MYKVCTKTPHKETWIYLSSSPYPPLPHSSTPGVVGHTCDHLARGVELYQLLCVGEEVPYADGGVGRDGAELPGPATAGVHRHPRHEGGVTPQDRLITLRKVVGR